jgi:hypothetical protein
VALNGTRSASVNRAPEVKSSYWVRLLEKPLTDDHHAGAAEAEECAEAHPDQQEQQADVEDQVAGLPQVAALGRHAAAVPGDPVAAPAQPVGGAVQHPVVIDDVVGEVAGGVRGQSGQVAGGLRRSGSDRPRVYADPRNDAADQGGEQQQVDRGEPG